MAKVTRTVAEIKEAERQRIAFYINRDGIKAAKEFMQQTYKIYRKARKTPYGKAYRLELIVSCLVFRHYLRRTCSVSS